MYKTSISAPPYKNKALGLGVGLLATLSVFSFGNHTQAATLDFDNSGWVTNITGSSASFTKNSSDSITLFSGTNNNGGVNHIITALVAGTVSFNWSFEATGQANNHPFGYLLGGEFISISGGTGTSQSGLNESFDVLAGQTFGFQVSKNNANPNNSSTTTITNFSFSPANTPSPTSVPEPSLLLGMIGIGALGMVSKKKKTA